MANMAALSNVFVAAAEKFNHVVTNVTFNNSL
jgi:hypothetical protein